MPYSLAAVETAFTWPSRALKSACSRARMSPSSRSWSYPTQMEVPRGLAPSPLAFRGLRLPPQRSARPPADKPPPRQGRVGLPGRVGPLQGAIGLTEAEHVGGGFCIAGSGRSAPTISCSSTKRPPLTQNLLGSKYGLHQIAHRWATACASPGSVGDLDLPRSPASASAGGRPWGPARRLARDDPERAPAGPATGAG